MEHNLAILQEAVAAVVPDRECIVFGDLRLTWEQVTERSRRFANYVAGRGLGLRADRAGLRGWESGQDHIALYLYNGNEYLEAMLGAYKARAVPFNVNYRYVAEELAYLLRDAGTRGIVYHTSLGPTLAEVLPQVPGLDVLIHVPDGPAEPLPGSVSYEEALAASSPERPALEWSGDDLYILYTGGTTGMPKGVLWRQADIITAALSGNPDLTPEQIAENSRTTSGKLLPAPPFMHGAAHWAAFNQLISGGTIVIQRNTRTLDPDDVLRTIERERASGVLLVGDAFARPLIDQMRKATYDLSDLRLVVSGGAVLSAPLKAELMELLPHAMVADMVGSSETGAQGSNISAGGGKPTTGTFARNPNARVLSDDLTRVLEPGDESMGWLAQTGRVPLGYLGDEAKTKATFPVIDGVRYSVPGDRARLLADGSIELHGRDSVTINSGGEKIFAEEVEQALRNHAAVYDVVVTGRPSERWGQEVVALVRLREGAGPSDQELLDECAKHIARYKLPKAIVRMDEIVRSPSGKADYRWAKAQVS